MQPTGLHTVLSVSPAACAQPGVLFSELGHTVGKSNFLMQFKLVF